MQDNCCFVQFFHPGSEATPRADRTDEYEWNSGTEHRRRFIRQRGDYLDRNGILHSGQPILFWGEWEAQGTATPIAIEEQIGGVNDGPRYICDPWYRPVRSNNTGGSSCGENIGCMNTDPFVFGDHFIYSNCQQRTYRDNPSQLQNLPPGSVILFGSHKEGHFHLDTVFVVDDNESHRYRPSDRDSVATVAELTSETFMHITAQPLSTIDTEFTLYRGVMYNAEMPTRPFSFVPCLPESAQSGGFARPVIEIEHIIRNTMTQHYALNAFDRASQMSMTRERAHVLWNEVRRQVEEQGLCLGVRVELPPRRN